jgi:uncharacterized protein YxeA
MANVDKVLEIFMDGNYFIIFLLLIVIVLIVLVLCLIKSREEYNELLRSTEREDYLDNSVANENTQSKEMDVFESMKEDEIDIFADFENIENDYLKISIYNEIKKIYPNFKFLQIPDELKILENFNISKKMICAAFKR